MPFFPIQNKTYCVPNGHLFCLNEYEFIGELSSVDTFSPALIQPHPFPKIATYFISENKE